ncbi:CLUMA_CG011523, isoform A [Clunio marinus]|uniref:CLUMA_CG011523, isoform A n=1 Tax=Clunio marinus TaxID=568069 RepID=A0A1J1IF25_9DIPT|nr:CLUMA_CG011523, isoform A [Clunio marinus]
MAYEIGMIAKLWTSKKFGLDFLVIFCASSNDDSGVKGSASKSTFAIYLCSCIVYNVTFIKAYLVVEMMEVMLML